MINVSIDDLQIARLDRVSVCESLNEHPAFEASVNPAVRSIDAMKCLGSEARVEVVDDGGGRKVDGFQGKITSVRMEGAPPRIRLQGKGASAALDVLRQTRCYAAPDPTPVAANLLPGLRSTFEDVADLTLLDARIHQALQWDETDWSLLRRLAAQSGASIQASIAGMRIVRSPSADAIQISSNDVIAGDTWLSVNAGVGDFKAVAWDAVGGEITSPAETSLRESDLRQVALNGGRRVRPGADSHQVYTPLGSAFPDAELTKRAAGVYSSSLASAGARLRRLDIALGSTIQLPDIPGKLRVTSRTLHYDAGAGGHQLTLTVEGWLDCSVLSSPRFAETAPRLLVGQVCAASPTANAPVVKVNFPWQKRSGNPANWEGAWCEVPQPTGGSNRNRHGVLVLPEPGDWVRVLVDTSGTLRPVVLGAVAPNNATLPDDWSAVRDRVLLVTSAGHLVVARESGADTSLLLALAEAGNSARKLCSIEMQSSKRIVLDAQGGEVEIRAKSVKVTSK